MGGDRARIFVVGAMANGRTRLLGGDEEVSSEGYRSKKLDRDTDFIWLSRHTLSNQSSPISSRMSGVVGGYTPTCGA